MIFKEMQISGHVVYLQGLILSDSIHKLMVSLLFHTELSLTVSIRGLDLWGVHMLLELSEVRSSDWEISLE